MNAAPSPVNTAVRTGALRRAVLLGATAGALVALSGCGFRLRGVQTLPFSVLRLQGNTGTPVAQGLREALLASGVQVLSAGTTAAPATQPQVVLTVLQDQREKTVVGQTAAGQVRELQLRTRFRFNLATPAGKLLLDNTELLLERAISYSETAALAKEAEEALLYRDMQSDIVQQVMRRLGSVKSL